MSSINNIGKIISLKLSEDKKELFLYDSNNNYLHIKLYEFRGINGAFDILEDEISILGKKPIFIYDRKMVISGKIKNVIIIDFEPNDEKKQYPDYLTIIKENFINDKNIEYDFEEVINKDCSNNLLNDLPNNLSNILPENILNNIKEKDLSEDLSEDLPNNFLDDTKEENLSDVKYNLSEEDILYEDQEGNEFLKINANYNNCELVFIGNDIEKAKMQNNLKNINIEFNFVENVDENSDLVKKIYKEDKIELKLLPYLLSNMKAMRIFYKKNLEYLIICNEPLLCPIRIFDILNDLKLKDIIFLSENTSCYIINKKHAFKILDKYSLPCEFWDKEFDPYDLFIPNKNLINIFIKELTGKITDNLYIDKNNKELLDPKILTENFYKITSQNLSAQDGMNFLLRYEIPSNEIDLINYLALSILYGYYINKEFFSYYAKNLKFKIQNNKDLEKYVQEERNCISNWLNFYNI